MLFVLYPNSKTVAEMIEDTCWYPVLHVHVYNRERETSSTAFEHFLKQQRMDFDLRWDHRSIQEDNFPVWEFYF